MSADFLCVVGLGANLGDRLATFEKAVPELANLGQLEGVSNLYETAPVGGPVQPDYFNAAVLLRTPLLPRALLDGLLSVERNHGRVRAERWGPRQLDLDILWIRDAVVDEPGLRVPHPRLSERAFALVPLMELIPDAKDPESGKAFRDIPINSAIRGLRLRGVLGTRAEGFRVGAGGAIWQLCR